MTDALTLPDGRAVVLGARVSGGAKNDTRFGTLPNGCSVVVKIQGDHGRLPMERVALDYVAQYGLPVPKVLGYGHTADGGYFLVLSRESGVRTNEPAGWTRMGRTYAQLAEVPTTSCPLPCTSAQEFVTDQSNRLRAVTDILSPGLRQQISKAIECFAAADRLVLTHGDPGSGNYLDNQDTGVILDWETACIAPFGIDAGRGAFFALLDNDRTGIPDKLSAAFISGYRAGFSLNVLSDSTLHAATTVAGLQFIHGRHARPLRPDWTSRKAVEVLEEYLATT